jgi:hypothetical protein
MNKEFGASRMNKPVCSELDLPYPNSGAPPISNVEEFRAAGTGQMQMMAKLAQIAWKPYVNRGRCRISGTQLAQPL